MIDIRPHVRVLYVRSDLGSKHLQRVTLIVPTSSEAAREALRQLEGQDVTISITPSGGEERSSRGTRGQAGAGIGSATTPKGRQPGPAAVANDEWCNQRVSHWRGWPWNRCMRKLPCPAHPAAVSEGTT